jgi:hypothetical protein
LTICFCSDAPIAALAVTLKKKEFHSHQRYFIVSEQKQTLRALRVVKAAPLTSSQKQNPVGGSLKKKD